MLHIQKCVLKVLTRVSSIDNLVFSSQGNTLRQYENRLKLISFDIEAKPPFMSIEDIILNNRGVRVITDFISSKSLRTPAGSDEENKFNKVTKVASEGGIFAFFIPI